MQWLRKHIFFILFLVVIAGVLIIVSIDQWYVPPGGDIKAYAKDCGVMLTAVFKDRKHTAALTPSSPWLVHSIARFVPTDMPVNVLEVGAGPGPVTRELIRRLAPESHLDAVELNPQLYTQLCDNLGHEQNDRISFHRAPIEEWQPIHDTTAYYDVIVSTLPRTQLPREVVRKILDRFYAMLKPGGIFIAVTLLGAHEVTRGVKWAHYQGAKTLSHLISDLSDAEKASKRLLDEYEGTVALIREWEQAHFVTLLTELVPWNLPPVYVMSLRKRIDSNPS